MEKLNVCLLNDSFPPFIDGVANTVVNYAEEIQKLGGSPVVVTPENPEAHDGDFSYPIYRYPAIDVRKFVGYYAGYPFAPSVAQKLKDQGIQIMHSHCPIASTMMARGFRDIVKTPLILTYHTKFDIDIENIVSSRLIQEGAARLLVDNINACDEVWTVSKGAGENLRSLGYEGDYIVMQNGVDMPRERLPEEETAEYLKDQDLPRGLPVFLFVGRLMWYKGIRIIIDALAALRSQDIDFRMVFVGKGQDEAEIKDYVRQSGLLGNTIFTGPIYDRRKLSAWYCRADLFLFPSTFDTNGLVVREAAARSLASVLIKGSCAAEGVTNGVNGFLVDENAASMAVLLARIIDKKELMRSAGERAASDLYISWADAIKAAYDRYPAVIENYKAGRYKKSLRPSDGLFKLSAEMMDSVNRFYERQNNIRRLLDPDEIRDRLNQLDANATQLLNRFELGDRDHLGRSKPKESPGSPQTAQEIQDKYL